MGTATQIPHSPASSIWRLRTTEIVKPDCTPTTNVLSVSRKLSNLSVHDNNTQSPQSVLCSEHGDIRNAVDTSRNHAKTPPCANTQHNPFSDIRMVHFRSLYKKILCSSMASRISMSSRDRCGAKKLVYLPNE